MQTNFAPAMKPVIVAPAKPAAARPAVANPLQASMKFQGNVKFAGDPRGNLFARIWNLVVGMFHKKVDDFEANDPELMANRDHNQVVQQTRDAIARLSRTIGLPAVLEREMKELLAKSEQERQEAEAAADLMLDKMKELGIEDENDARLNSYRALMLKEEGEAEKSLLAYELKKTAYDAAVKAAQEARTTIEALQEKQEVELQRIEKSRQDAATIAALKEIKANRATLEEMKTTSIGLTNSAQHRHRELEIQRAALEAELRGGQTVEEQQSTADAEKELKNRQKGKRVSELLAKRRAAAGGAVTQEKTAEQGGSGDDNVKPGS